MVIKTQRDRVVRDYFKRGLKTDEIATIYGMKRIAVSLIITNYRKRYQWGKNIQYSDYIEEEAKKSKKLSGRDFLRSKICEN